MVWKTQGAAPLVTTGEALEAVRRALSGSAPARVQRERAAA